MILSSRFRFVIVTTVVLKVDEQSEKSHSVVGPRLVKDGGQVKLDSAFPNAKRLTDICSR